MLSIVFLSSCRDFSISYSKWPLIFVAQDRQLFLCFDIVNLHYAKWPKMHNCLVEFLHSLLTSFQVVLVESRAMFAFALLLFLYKLLCTQPQAGTCRYVYVHLRAGSQTSGSISTNRTMAMPSYPGNGITASTTT